MRSTSTLFATLLAFASISMANAGTSLLNVSYDVARDFYKDFNPIIQKQWKAVNGETHELKQPEGN